MELSCKKKRPLCLFFIFYLKQSLYLEKLPKRRKLHVCFMHRCVSEQVSRDDSDCKQLYTVKPAKKRFSAEIFTVCSETSLINRFFAGFDHVQVFTFKSWKNLKVLMFISLSLTCSGDKLRFVCFSKFTSCLSADAELVLLSENYTSG